MERSSINAKKLAEKADVGASFVYDILNGNSKNPTINKLSSIADILGVDVSYLLNDDNNTNNNDNIIEIKSLLLESSETSDDLVFESYTSQPYYFQKEWIEKQLNTSPSNLFILITNEDIPSLSIQKNDILIIDTTKNHVIYENIFLIKKADKIFLHKFEENNDNIDNSKIIGQIVWLSRRINTQQNSKIINT